MVRREHAAAAAPKNEGRTEARRSSSDNDDVVHGGWMCKSCAAGWMVGGWIVDWVAVWMGWPEGDEWRDGGTCRFRTSISFSPMS